MLNTKLGFPQIVVAFKTLSLTPGHKSMGQCAVIPQPSVPQSSAHVCVSVAVVSIQSSAHVCVSVAVVSIQSSAHVCICSSG